MIPGDAAGVRGEGSSRRVFTALPLPPPALQLLQGAGRELSRRTESLRVVRADGMHVTLIFFGELEEESLGRVERALADPALAVPAVQASLGGLGQFPPRGAPRVLYCPILRGAGEIEALYRRLRTVLGDAWRAQPPGPGAAGRSTAGRPAWDDPRPFTPHVTVARVRGGQVRLEDLEGLFDFEYPVILDRLVLFQSDLRPGGAEYRPLKTVNLTGEGRH